jgi:hypothetical protein
MKNLWRPIEELTNRYQQPLMIAAPCLIHGDSNPLGIAEGFWTDICEGWQTTTYDMCNDEWNTVVIPAEAVTHFLIPEGPWTQEECDTLQEDPAVEAMIMRIKHPLDDSFYQKKETPGG